MSEDLLKPADVCRRLGMPSSTLRIYSTKFDELLSEAARKSGMGDAGRGGHRLYSSRDLLVLTRAKELLGQGMTYDQALEELRLSVPATRRREKPEPQQSGVNVAPSVEGTVSADVLKGVFDALRDVAAQNDRALEAYRLLAEAERAELTSLRERVSRLEAEVERLSRLEAEVGRLRDQRDQGEDRDEVKRSWMDKMLGR